MKLFEYQAKDLFEESNIPVPNRKLIKDQQELEMNIKDVPTPCVVKAQILQGGRGKAGLIQFAQSKEEIKVKANQIFDSPKNVQKLLLEETINIDKEIYLSITIDPASSQAMIMACEEGGVDIEDIARNTPEKIITEYVDLSKGLLPFQARNVMHELDLNKQIARQGSKILLNLYDLFRKYEAELIEINPLTITKEGAMIAADGKVDLDDNASQRQDNFSLTREYFSTDAQYEAALEGIPYLQFDGDIGLMCAGAGLTNAVYDLVHYHGGSIANYLEFGGPNYHKALKSMEIILENKPKVILVVTFGTIARADVMAQGIVDAIDQLDPKIPIVTAIRGTGEEEAKKLLQSVGLEIIDDTEEAVEKAVKLAGGGVAL